MSELQAWLHRVGRRLAREELQVENVADWQPNAPGGYGFAEDAPIGRQSVAATFENDLTITIFSSLTLTVLLTGLVRRPDGSTQPIGPGGAGFTVSVVGDRVPRSVTFPRGSGVEVIGLSVVVSVSAVAVPLGSVWAIVQQSRALPTGLTVITSTLVSGPVSTSQALGWPGSPVLASTNSPYARSFGVANPGANIHWSSTVPTNARWEILSICATFQNSSAGATWVQFAGEVTIPVFGLAVKVLTFQNTNAIASGAVCSVVASVGAAEIQRPDLTAFTVPWPSGLQMQAAEFVQSGAGIANLFNWTGISICVNERLDP